MGFIEVGSITTRSELNRYGYNEYPNNIFFKEKGCFVEVEPLKDGGFRVIRAKDCGKKVERVGFYQPIIRFKPPWKK